MIAEQHQFNGGSTRWALTAVQLVSLLAIGEAQDGEVSHGSPWAEAKVEGRPEGQTGSRRGCHEECTPNLKILPLWKEILCESFGGTTTSKIPASIIVNRGWHLVYGRLFWGLRVFRNSSWCERSVWCIGALQPWGVAPQMKSCLGIPCWICRPCRLLDSCILAPNVTPPSPNLNSAQQDVGLRWHLQPENSMHSVHMRSPKPYGWPGKFKMLF